MSGSPGAAEEAEPRRLVLRTDGLLVGLRLSGQRLGRALVRRAVSREHGAAEDDELVCEAVIATESG